MKIKILHKKLNPTPSNSEIFKNEFYFTEKFMNMKFPLRYNNNELLSKQFEYAPSRNLNDDSFFYQRQDKLIKLSIKLFIGRYQKS